jgi:hypothetical protein
MLATTLLPKVITCMILFILRPLTTPSRVPCMEATIDVFLSECILLSPPYATYALWLTISVTKGQKSVIACTISLAHAELGARGTFSHFLQFSRRHVVLQNTSVSAKLKSWSIGCRLSWIPLIASIDAKATFIQRCWTTVGMCLVAYHSGFAF